MTAVGELGAAVVKPDSVWAVVSYHGVKIAVDVSGTRELGESLEYGIVALVDIAIIALSPAINDPNSAVEVIEEMSFLFPDLANTPLGPHAYPDADSWPRIVIARRTFGELVTLATEQIVLYGADDPNVQRALHRFAHSLQRIELDETDRAHIDTFTCKRHGTRLTQPLAGASDNRFFPRNTKIHIMLSFIKLDSKELLPRGDGCQLKIFRKLCGRNGNKIIRNL